MGKVTGMVYAAIYLVLCGMVLTLAMEAMTLTCVLWAVAALMFVALCVFGKGSGRLASDGDARTSGAERTVLASRRPATKKRMSPKSGPRAAWHEAAGLESDTRERNRLEM